MKNIGIHEPCSENFSAMTPTEKGAFCQKCATQVYDFTNKTNEEIKQTLRLLIGQPVCGRITAAQEDALNAEFEAWMFRSKCSFQSALLLSLIVVFGMTLFSCSHEEDKVKIEQIRTSAIQVMQQQPEEKPVGAETVPARQVAVPEEELQPEITAIELQPSMLDEVVINNDYYGGYGHGGAMVSTVNYQTYLMETVPVIEELDASGHPYPKTFEALAFPNPATTETTIDLAVPVKNQFEVVLYDMNGQFLQTVYSGEIDRGTFRQQIDLSNRTPGMYLIAILSKDYRETVKVNKI